METKLISPTDNSKSTCSMITLQSTVTVHDVVEVQYEPNTYLKHTDSITGNVTYYRLIDQTNCIQVAIRNTYTSVIKASPDMWATQILSSKPVPVNEYIDTLFVAFVDLGATIHPSITQET